MNLIHVPDIKVRFLLRDNSSPLFDVLALSSPQSGQWLKPAAGESHEKPCALAGGGHGILLCSLFKTCICQPGDRPISPPWDERDSLKTCPAASQAKDW